jgi:hypothetical protein
MVGILGGAPAPIIATALVRWAGGASWPVAMYLAATSLVSLIAVYLESERHRVGVEDRVQSSAASFPAAAD